MPCGFTPSDLLFLDLTPRSAQEFATAIWANAFHFLRTMCAKGAFVRANVSFAVGAQLASASLALCSHLERHVVSPSPKFIV